jgi:hypothetical protein
MFSMLGGEIMKRTFFLLLLISCILAPITAAADYNGFFVLEQTSNSVEIYNAANQRVNTFKSAPKPARIVKNPNNDNHGTTRSTGGLILAPIRGILLAATPKGVVSQAFCTYNPLRGSVISASLHYLPSNLLQLGF